MDARLMATLALLVTVASVALWLVLGSRARGWFRAPGSRSWETELSVVFGAAAKMAQEDGAEDVDTVHFVLAASASPDVAAGLERTGLTVVELRSQLARERARRAGKMPCDRARVMRSSPALVEGVRHAVRKARRGGEGEVLLVHVLEGLCASGTDEATRLLREREVAFREGAFMVTYTDDAPPPPMIHVWNDAVSNMESVAAVLRRVFQKSDVDALYVTLSVHLRGHAALGPFPADEIDALVDHALRCARELGMPDLVIDRSPPDTTGWRTTDRGLLP